VIDAVDLRLLHALVDVVILDLADAHEGGEQGYRDGDGGVELAASRLLRFVLCVVRYREVP